MCELLVAVFRLLLVEHAAQGFEVAVGDAGIFGAGLLAGMGADALRDGTQLLACGLGENLKFRRPLQVIEIVEGVLHRRPGGDDAVAGEKQD